MNHYSQERFIKNWNKIASILSKQERFKQCIQLNSHSLSSGACCGFSFVLAEYVRLGREEDFYKIYNTICDADPNRLANQILAKTGHYEGLDFVYKITIFQTLQNQLPLTEVPENESKQELFAREYCSSGNHQRIGSSIKNAQTDFDIITNVELKNGAGTKLLPEWLHALQENESYEVGFYDNYGAHSILIYRYNNAFHLFDSNIGIKVTSDTAEQAAEQIIFSANTNLTQGTNKYSNFDKLWDENTYLIVLIALIVPPMVFLWLIYDVFIAKPLSDETLKHGPLSNTLWMSWGKIKAIPEPEPSSLKNNAYFGLPWLGKESSVTEASSETFQLSTSPN